MWQTRPGRPVLAPAAEGPAAGTRGGRDTGVLLMAYGTPETLDDVPAYYTHIRGGRAPSPALVEELKERYRAIGGRSPLLEITRAQAEGLSSQLGLPVYVGMRHWHPYIADTVARMAADGIRQAVALALAPQYSRLSVELYLQAAREAAAPAGLTLLEVRHWHDHPLFLDHLASRVREALARFPAAERDQVHGLFTAHSLPTRILQWDDPYPRQLEETAAAVAARAGIVRWHFAYQSAGRTPEPWLGPDILTRLRELAEQGVRRVVVCPVGFVADHLEVLYDVDVEARHVAAELGLHLERTASPNADPTFVAALADVVRQRLAQGGEAV